MFLVKNNKSPYYQIVYFENGKRKTKSTRSKSRCEAEKFLNSFTPELKILNFRTDVSIKNTTISLKEFSDEYLNYSRPIKSKKYFEQIEYSFLQFSKYTRNIRLNKVQLRLIDNFIMSIFPKSAYLAYLHFRILKAAFSKAVDWEYIEQNPFKKIKFPRIPKSIPIFITQDEFNIIIYHTKNQLLRNIFTVAFYTGMRLGEIVNMKWNWIDMENETITTKLSLQFNTKSKKERLIPMNSIVSQVINKYYSQARGSITGHIFTQVKDVKLNEDYVSKNFKKSVRAAGLNDKIHFHTLRHSFASLLVQKGVSLFVIKELLGHSDLATTQIYSHLQFENLSNAVNMI